MWFSKLNGWQRIWVVLSIIYFLVVITVSGFIINDVRPSSVKIKKDYSYKFKLSLMANSDFRGLLDDAKQIVIERLLNNDEILNKFGHKKHLNNKFLDIKEQYKNELSELNKKQLHFFIKSIVIFLLVWLIPICLIYVFGLSVRWVINGFTSQ